MTRWLKGPVPYEQHQDSFQKQDASNILAEDDGSVKRSLKKEAKTTEEAEFNLQETPVVSEILAKVKSVTMRSSPKSSGQKLMTESSTHY